MEKYYDVSKQDDKYILLMAAVQGGLLQEYERFNQLYKHDMFDSDLKRFEEWKDCERLQAC